TGVPFRTKRGGRRKKRAGSGNAVQHSRGVGRISKRRDKNIAEITSGESTGDREAIYSPERRARTSSNELPSYPRLTLEVRLFSRFSTNGCLLRFGLIDKTCGATC
ncbi:unnamed protein product, partial [Ectocarpus sp. 12 AP-2014]